MDDRVMTARERELANHAVRIESLEKEVERLRIRLHAVANDQATLQAAAFLKREGALPTTLGTQGAVTWQMLSLFIGGCVATGAIAVSVAVWIMSRP